MSLLRGAGVLALEVLARFAYALLCLAVVDDRWLSSEVFDTFVG